MMTVEGREPLKVQLIRRHTLFPVPWILPITLLFLGILAVFGIFITSGISALALLRCLRAPCHLVGLSLSLLLLWHSLFQFPLPSPPHSAQLPRPTSLGPTLLARPNSLGPTLLARPNSLGPTHSAQLTRPSSLDPIIPTRLNSPGPTHPTQPARPISLGLTHSPSSFDPTQLTWSHSVNPARSTCHVTNSLAGQPTNHLPSGITCSQNPHASLYSPLISNDFVVTTRGWTFLMTIPYPLIVCHVSLCHVYVCCI